LPNLVRLKKLSVEESKDNRTTRLLILKEIRKSLQYYDHQSDTKLDRNLLDELMATLTQLNQTAQDSGKKIYKQKVEVAVTKILSIILNRFPISTFDHNGQNFLELPILANLSTHPNMFPVYKEYIYALKEAGEQGKISNEILPQIVPKLLLRINKLREKSQIETNKKEPLTSKSELILTLSALSSIMSTCGDLFKPFIASTLEQVEFLLYNCLISIGVQTISVLTQIFKIEFQPKKFTPICNKFIDILNHRYEQDKVLIRSDQKDEEVDVESDLNFAVLEFFSNLLEAGLLKIMIENASNHMITLYHLITNSLAKELTYETDFAERIEQSKIALQFLQESSKLELLQPTHTKEFFIHHLDAIKFALKDQDTLLAIEFLKSINKLLTFNHNDQNPIITNLLQHLNETPKKKNKKKDNSTNLQIFVRHLKELSNMINKYEILDQSDDEEDDEFSREMQIKNSEEIKHNFNKESQDLFENLKRYGFNI
jgi:hypothetical protein